MSRLQIASMFIGAQRTGKTQFALQSFKNYPATKRGLIVLPHLMEKKYEGLKTINIDQVGTFKGRARVLFDRDDKLFLNKIYRNYRNGFIIFDDTKFCLRPWLYNDFEDILGTRRQLNLDMIFMYHGFDRIPDFFWNYCSHLVLFKTLSAEGADKVNQERQAHVNKMAQRNPYAKKIYLLNG